MKVSNWIVIDGYCATRVLEGTDHTKIKNRVAFIEKIPKVRIAPYTTEIEDWKNWKCGDKGSGGTWNSDHEYLQQYGFDLESRKWCDEELIKLGYTL